MACTQIPRQHLITGVPCLSRETEPHSRNTIIVMTGAAGAEFLVACGHNAAVRGDQKDAETMGELAASLPAAAQLLGSTAAGSLI